MEESQGVKSTIVKCKWSVLSKCVLFYTYYCGSERGSDFDTLFPIVKGNNNDISVGRGGGFSCIFLCMF